MGTAPAALRAAITRDHFPEWTVELVRPDGSSLTVDTLIGGTVTKDAGRWPRTTAQLVCAVPTLTPAPLDPAFLPFGSRARISWRVQGVAASVLVADLLIVGTDVARPDATVTLTCADDSAQADTVGFDIPSDTGAAKSATALVTWAAQWARPVTWPALVVAGSLPAGTIPTIDTTNITSAWALIEQVATGVGGEAWFDAQRRLRLRATPTPGSSSASVAHLVVGEGGTVTGYRSTLNRAPNAVYVKFGTDDTWGFWFDTDPTSPTFYDGTTLYGWVEDRTGVFEYVPESVDVFAAAAAYATRVGARVRTCELRAVPAPWIEPGDTVTVGVLGAADELHLVQSVTFPLTLDVMTCTTRTPYTTGGLI